MSNLSYDLSHISLNEHHSQLAGVEGISDFFAPFYKQIESVFGESGFAAGLSELFKSREVTLLDKGLENDLLKLGYSIVENIDIPKPAHLSGDFPGYVNKLEDGISRLSNVDSRLLVTTTDWLNYAVAKPDGMTRAFPGLSKIDCMPIRKGIANHFELKQVSTRGPEVSRFGDLYRSVGDFQRTGIALAKLDRLFAVFNYAKIITAEEALMTAVKRFSNLDEPVKLEDITRKRLIEALTSAGEELELLATLLYGAKVAATNYKLSQDVLREAFTKTNS